MRTYDPIQDPSFVGEEHYTDDEVVEYGLYGFHRVSRCEARRLANAEEDASDEEDDFYQNYNEEDDFYQNYNEEPDEPALTAQAVEDALRLQDFFARLRDEPKDFTFDEEMEDRCSFPAEVEIEERPIVFSRGYSYSRQSSKGHVRRKFHRETFAVIGEWYVPGQRTHGGNDTRRYRRNDSKLLGGSHRRQDIFGDHTMDIQPVAAILPDGRRIRIR